MHEIQVWNLYQLSQLKVTIAQRFQQAFLTLTCQPL